MAENESPSNKGKGQNGIYIALAAILAVILVVQIVYLRSSRNSPAPNSFTKNGPSSGPPPSGQPSMRPQDQPVQDLYAGTAPSADPSTWVMVPGHFIVDAFAATDSASPLSAAQARDVLKLVSEASEQMAAARTAQANFVATARATLDAAQIALIAQSKTAILQTALDPKAILAALKTKSDKATNATVTPTVGDDDAGADFVFAALGALEKTDQALKPEQARALYQPASKMIDALTAQTPLFAKLAKVLNEKQREAWSQNVIKLVAANSDNHALTTPELIARLKQRSGQ